MDSAIFSSGVTVCHGTSHSAGSRDGQEKQEPFRLRQETAR
jgi:hypothetical protein